MTVYDYIIQARESIMEVYESQKNEDKELNNKIKFLALDTLMHLDQCLSKMRETNGVD